jgi:hypothetical protein
MSECLSQESNLDTGPIKAGSAIELLRLEVGALIKGPHSARQHATLPQLEPNGLQRPDSEGECYEQ